VTLVGAPHTPKKGELGKNDIPDFDDHYKGPQDTSPNQPMQTVTKSCNAGCLCRMENVQVIVEGKGYNGGICCKCVRTFHNTCLYVHEGATYCITCFKMHVVSHCSTETLFADVLSQQDDSNSSAGRGLNLNANDLVKFVDKFLQEQNLPMTLKRFYKWCKKTRHFLNNHPCTSLRDKEKRYDLFHEFTHKRKKYETVIKLAKEEWMLSTDGVVKALRYRAKDKQFVAQVHYKEGTRLVEEKITVSDDWVIDTYGKELAKKLIDHEENNEFIMPVTADGRLATIHVDERKITRVKYIPPKYVHETDARGNDQVTTDACTEGVWKGLLEDGTSLTIAEDMVRQQFGFRFVAECKILGHKKFVALPVGSCRYSIMKMFPELRCEKAPPVKFMQGGIDTCVFSSLASAFHQTSIPDLVRVANILQTKSKSHCGGTKSLTEARNIVTENVKWLQARRCPKTFEWEDDINDYMFFVGVIKDNTNSCQHAITIFRNWIYDSNEPFALPLSKESLDCCTWEIKDGEIKNASLFVSFIDGWIFQERETKKKKILDMCANPANVKQA
jgi:hypothetical protein